MDPGERHRLTGSDEDDLHQLSRMNRPVDDEKQYRLIRNIGIIVIIVLLAILCTFLLQYRRSQYLLMKELKTLNDRVLKLSNEAEDRDKHKVGVEHDHPPLKFDYPTLGVPNPGDTFDMR